VDCKMKDIYDIKEHAEKAKKHLAKAKHHIVKHAKRKPPHPYLVYASIFTVFILFLIVQKVNIEIPSIGVTGYHSHFGEISDGGVVPGISFVSPTPANGSNIINSTIINVSITNASSISEVKWILNGTNYTFYNDSLILLMNLNNNSNIGENSTSFVDISKYRNNGTCSNCPVLNPNGKYGNALSFNGVTSYVDLGPWFNYQEFTISMWINPASSQNQYADILDNNHDGDSNWALQQDSSNNNQYGWGGSFTLSANNWQHLTIQRSGTTCYSYVNGVLVTSATCYPSGINYDSSPSRNLNIGRHNTLGRYWNGTLDEIAIWNRSLTADEIQQYYYLSLYKQSSNSWNLISNRTFESNGYHNYSAYIKDIDGNTNSTETRFINVTSSTTIISTNTVLSKGNYIYDNLIIKNGATLTVAGNSTIGVTGNIIVQESSTILLQGNFTNNTNGIGVTINTANITVESGSTISANAQGYTGRTGSQGVGNGSGGGNFGGGWGGGAAYGSIAQQDGGVASPAVYGSPITPTDLGSGGGAWGNDVTGNGGGAIRLNVTDTLTLTGTITANGGNGVGFAGGAGSGGSIYVTTGTIAGNGTFRARGGNGSPGGSASNAGGGGRIVIYYTNSSASNNLFIGSNASCGDSRDGTTTWCGNGQTGGTSGYFQVNNLSNHYSDITRSLTIYQNFVYANDTILNIQNITTMNNGILIIGGNSTLNISGTLLARNTSTITLKGRNVDNSSGGIGVTINAANLTVESGSKISADSQGYTGKTGGQGNGNGPGGGNFAGGWGGGGAYGSTAQTDGGVTSPAVYGSPITPTDLGSGGGAWSTDAAGNGGGSIRLNISGTLKLDGTIAAIGANGNGFNGGAGSGGSIYVTTATIAGSGIFKARGGNAAQGGSASNAGGGGRIAIYYTNSTASDNLFTASNASCGDSRDGTTTWCANGQTGGTKMVAFYTTSVNTCTSTYCIDDTYGDFILGNLKNVFALQNDSIILQSNFTNGTFLSRIFDLGNTFVWKNISWTPGVPYQQELPNNSIVESVLGGANMTGNVLLMHMNEASATNNTKITDSSGLGNNGTLILNSTLQNATNISGKFGNAISFDGVDDYVNISDSNSLDLTTDLSISLWVKLSSIKNSGFVLRSTNGYAFYMYSTGKVGFGKNGVDEIQSNSILAINTWYHVTATHTGGVSKIYINGVEDKSGATNDFSALTTSILIGTNPGDINGWVLNGSIDEVAVYNRSLSTTEILNQYKRGALSLNLSIRSCDDSICSGETFAAISNTNPQSLSLSQNRYFQYNTTLFTENTTYTPQLFNITISYTDEALPNITFVNPTDSSGSIVGRNYTFVNVTVVDSSNISTCLLEWTNSSSSTNITMTKSANSSSIYCYYNKSVAVDGNYSYKIWANDSSSNMNVTATRTILFDNTAINLTYVDPTDSTGSVKRNWTYINVTVVDISNISSCLLQWTNSSGSVNISMTKIGSGNSVSCNYNKTESDGNYSYKVYANDSLNIFDSTQTRSIIFDTTSPSITGHIPNGTITSSSASLNITTNENSTCRYSTSSNIAYINMTGIFTDSSTLHNVSLSSLSNGAKTYYVRCNDTVGNINETDYLATFTVSVSSSGFTSSSNSGSGSIPNSPTTQTTTSTSTTTTTSSSQTTKETTQTTTESTNEKTSTQSTNTPTSDQTISVEGNSPFGNFVKPDEFKALIYDNVVNQVIENELNKQALRTEVVEEKNDVITEVDTRSSIEIVKTEIPIRQVSFESTKSARAFVIIGTTTLPERIVERPYRYVSIETTSDQLEVKKDVSKVTIKFQVEKSWLEKNNIDKKEINLARYEPELKYWRRLSTRILEETTDLVIYEAESPSLSLYAIEAKPLSCMCPPEGEWSVCTNDQSNRISYECSSQTSGSCIPKVEKKSCTTGQILNEKKLDEYKPASPVEQEQAQEKNNNMLLIIAAVVGVVVIGVVVGMFGLRSKKSESAV